MSKKLNLILGACGHLPHGTGEAEFETLYNKEIKPLVQALDKFPRINMVFHYSGVILYWIERRHPEFFMLLEDLLSRKQAEFLGGGFYNPLLPLLPQTDKIGQIEMLTTYLRKQFGKRPQGCWLPAMAWEQNLVGPLNSCGMNYTFLDDLLFSGAGVKPNAQGLFFPCITEDQGKLITIFPVAKALGRALRAGVSLPAVTGKAQANGAVKILEELLEKLPDTPSGAGTDPGSIACEGSRLSPQTDEFPVMVFPFTREAMSPMEKDEETWPESAYENFLGELSNADSRIEFTTSARVFKNLIGLKKVYFPGVLANENAFTHPRQFLADHGGAGGIYAKMMHVHTLINNQLRGDRARKRTALEELWKAQDSGVFRLGTAASPGLLHSPVRKAAYHSLLEGEKIAREKGKLTPSLSVFDFDLDGEGEYIFQDDKLNCCVKSKGAGIFELDYLPAAWNYLDTLAPVNVSSAPSQGSERRSAFVDWFAPAGTPADDAGPTGIPGGRFCGFEEYEAGETDRVRRRQGFKLPAKEGRPWGEIEIEKIWQLKKNSLVLEYILKNTETRYMNFVFCPQFDLSFPGEGEAFLRILAIREGEKESAAFSDALTIRDMRGLEFQDIKNETLITLEANRGFDARVFQIRTDIPSSGLNSGQPESRQEYQSTCVMPFFPVSLEAGKTWKAGFSLRISS